MLVVIRVIASEKNWIDGMAVEQLKKTGELPGARVAVGMPDLHPGKGSPIGAVFAIEGIIYPNLVGNDVGCGMSLWQTEIASTKLKLDRWAKRLEGLESAWEGDAQKFLESRDVNCTQFDRSLGTIGGGNHFAELQRVQEVHDQDHFESIGLDRDYLFLLVHSGSRGVGEHVLQGHSTQFGTAGLCEGSPEAAAYLSAHDHAIRWARSNRELIALRFMDALGTRGKCLIDICHNLVQPAIVDGAACWLHRKGAAPSDLGPVVIAGSRGAASYLVVATGDQSKNLSTVAHGAGRKWSRGECRSKLEKRFSSDSLRQTTFGGHVICEDKDLLYEEAPQAYKNIDIVIKDLIDEGLVKAVASFTPLITYKTRSGNR